MESHKHDLIEIKVLRIITMIMVVRLLYLNFCGILWQNVVWNRWITWCIRSLLFYYCKVLCADQWLFLINNRFFIGQRYENSGVLWLFILIFLYYFVDTSGHWSLYKIVHYSLLVRYSMYWLITAYFIELAGIHYTNAIKQICTAIVTIWNYNMKRKRCEKGNKSLM